MITKKRTIGLLLICLLTVGIASVYAAGNEGLPFDEIWEAIFGVQEDMEDLQEQMNLQQQISDLQAEVEFLMEHYAILNLVSGPTGPAGPSGPQGEIGLPGSDADCTELEAQMSLLYSEYLALEYATITALDSLATQHSEDIALLQGQIDALEVTPAGLGVPDFDSGWIAIEPGGIETLHHGLSQPTNVFGIMIGSNTLYNYNVHQVHYGGNAAFGATEETRSGAYWWVTGSTITISRFSEDLLYEQIRVLLWELPPPSP